MKFGVIITLVLATLLNADLIAYADETVGEKISNTATHAKNSTKKAYRKAKDKTCEMINGKMQCAEKKLRHQTQNATDAADAKAKEVKNKIDK